MPFDAELRWNEWNLEHASRHGCSLIEIQRVVRNAGRGFPRYIGDGKWRVVGRGTGDRMMEVIFVEDGPGEETIYVIHAMPLTTRRRRGGR